MNVEKGLMSAGVTPAGQQMTCFEERTSIWPTDGAPWPSKLNCSNKKNLGLKTPNR
jgi:hypothetical protein